MFGKKKTDKIVKINQPQNSAAEFSLDQNTPNPFSGQTSICFSVPRSGNIRIIVYNRREDLQCILHNGHLAPGSYRLMWDGTDAESRALKPGSYSYCLAAEGVFVTRKLTIKNSEK